MAMNGPISRQCGVPPAMYPPRISPNSVSTIARRTTWANNPSRLAPAATRRSNENVIATPTMNRNAGNTRSVGVHPFHSACRNGPYTALHVPGLFTMIIEAMVIPRNTSSDISLSELSTGDSCDIRPPTKRSHFCRLTAPSRFLFSGAACGTASY